MLPSQPARYNREVLIRKAACIRNYTVPTEEVLQDLRMPIRRGEYDCISMMINEREKTRIELAIRREKVPDKVLLGLPTILVVPLLRLIDISLLHLPRLKAERKNATGLLFDGEVGHAYQGCTSAPPTVDIVLSMGDRPKTSELLKRLGLAA